MATGTALIDEVAAEAFELREGISLLEAASAPSIVKPDGSVIELGFDGSGNAKPGGVFDAAGRVPLHIIRPGIGRGRGRHLYEADMLREAAPNFQGWKMFLNHQSPEAKKAAGGLPRDIRDSGGRVQESWWDPSVAASDSHGQGAVVGMVRPVKFIRDLIEDDTDLAEASISASATGVRPVTRDGQRVWLVEGINPRGSVDWVTEAGAGGRIAPMLEEAYAEEEDRRMALLESMTDDELYEHLRNARPALLESKKSDDAEDAKDGGADETEERVTALMKRGMSRDAAVKAASKALSESTTPEGGEVAEITPEALAEALSASPNLLVEALTASAEAQVFIASLVEAKIEDEREHIRAESKAEVDRAFQLSKFERTAHGLIGESKLPASWQSDLKSRFCLVENEPTPGLDVEDDVDDDGKVTKPAIDKLREAVEAEIGKERERLREASSTRVRHAAPVKLTEAKEDEGDKKPSGPQPYWQQILSEAGVHDPSTAYSLEG